MAEIPNTNARRPMPRFGGALQARGVVADGSVEEGRAQQNLGGQLSAFAKRTQAYIDREQAKRDDREVRSLRTKLAERMLAMQSEFSQRHGAEVATDKEYFKTWAGKFDEARGEIADDASNPDVAGAFGEIADLESVNYQRSLTGHLIRETEAWAETEYSKGVSIYQKTMASNYTDDSAVQQARDAIEFMTEDYAAERGIPLDSDVYISMLATNLTVGHKNVIERFLADGNVSDAREHFDEYVKLGEITGDVQDELVKMMNSIGVDRMSMEYSDMLFAERPREMNDEEFEKWGLKRIRDEADPQYRDATLSRFKARISEESGLSKKIQTAYGDEGSTIMQEALEAGTKPMDAYKAIPKLVLEKMSPAVRSALWNKATRLAQDQSIHTQFDAWNNLMNLATGTEAERAIFGTIDLNEYSDRISTDDLKRFAVMKSDPEQVSIASSLNDIRKDLTSALGITKADSEAAGEVKRRLDDEMRAFKASTGNDAGPDEVQKIADRLLLKYFKPGRFFGTNEFTAYEGGVVAPPLIDASGELREGATTVPRELTDEMVGFTHSLLGKNNEDNLPSGADVAHVYRLYQYIQQQQKRYNEEGPITTMDMVKAYSHWVKLFPRSSPVDASQAFSRNVRPKRPEEVDPLYRSRMDRTGQAQ